MGIFNLIFPNWQPSMVIICCIKHWPFQLNEQEVWHEHDTYIRHTKSSAESSFIHRWTQFKKSVIFLHFIRSFYTFLLANYFVYYQASFNQMPERTLYNKFKISTSLLCIEKWIQKTKRLLSFLWILYVFS